MDASRNISTLGLRGLRTFEAAARHLNFTKAADELCVTTAAVSHQIKEVESQLGVPLFTRSGRAVRLSAEGEVMQQAVVDAITALERGIARLGARRRQDQVRVSAGPSLAAKWLVPRLERFLQLHPAADIQVDVSFLETDVARDAADLTLRYGPVQLAQACVDPLFVESLFPVCSPRLLAGRAPLRLPQELLAFKLIHVDWAASRGHWPTWASWMQAAGLHGFDAHHGLHFQQTSLAIDAAIAGQGVALGEASLVMDDLASGRLIQPLATDIPIRAAAAYYLVGRQDALARPMVAAFREWLLEEARRYQSSRAE